MQGLVVEIGAEPQYHHERHLPNVDYYLPTNLGGEVGAIVDATNTPFGTASLDGIICVSVIEHIHDVRAVFAEFSRTLRSGGLLLAAVPFCYPIHDVQDHWRPTDQALLEMLGHDFDPIRMTRMGGKISVVSELLQRPEGKYGKRYLPIKVFGGAFAMVFGRFDQPDDSPLGFGVVARRR